MTRHSKNSTANPCYTYHERKKDSKESGYGSQTLRLSKDAVRPSDCCSLTLQPAKEPVVTSEGYLYDRSAVIEFMVHEKEAIALRLKQWKKRKEQSEDAEHQREEAQRKIAADKFVAAERHVVSSPSSDSKAKPGSNASNFWVPGLATKPSSEPSSSSMEAPPPKPDDVVRCPMSGKPLKLKDLMPVHFKRARKDGSEPTTSSILCLENGDYVCALTGDILTNAQQLAVLKPSGAVVLQSAAEQILKFEEKNSSEGTVVMDPVANKPLEGLIPLKRGGSGFAAAAGSDMSQIQATVKFPVLSIS